MSSQNYTITHYGIIIPIDDSKLYNHVIKQLISKNKQLYKISDEDELDFLYELQFKEEQSFHISYNAENIEIITLNDDDREIYAIDVLILIGNHDVPTLYSAPFKSKQDCINHYKKQFGDILPKDFDYENNIGRISYVT